MRVNKRKTLVEKHPTAAMDCSVKVASRFLMVTAGFWYCLILQYLQEIFWFCWPEIINVYWQNRGQNGYLSSHSQGDTTKTVWWIKPLPTLIKMNLIDMEQNSKQLILYLKTICYSLTAHSYMTFKFNSGLHLGCLC